jgi:hypothetical protein
MQSEPVFYIVHIHTPKMDYYALRDSLENAQEEVFLHAQSEWRDQFPGVERPISKVETAEWISSPKVIGLWMILINPIQFHRKITQLETRDYIKFKFYIGE